MLTQAAHFEGLAEPVPAKLFAPIDVSRIHDEKGVKSLIKQLLNAWGYFTWMPNANGYGTQGISDHAAIKDGVFVVIEAKYGVNKPKPTQKAFAAQIIANDGFAFCVNERNIDHLAMWLESFHVATLCTSKEQEVPPEHGARMLNAIGALTEMWE